MKIAREARERQHRKRRLDFPRTGKIFARFSSHRNSFSPVSSPELTESRLFDIGYSVSIFQSFTARSDFRTVPPFFPPSPLFLLYLRPCARKARSVHYPLTFRPTCIGKYESFVPSALSGTYVCHRHTREICSDIGSRMCMRTCGCLFAGGDKDRSWRVVHAMKKTDRPGTETSTGAEDDQTDALPGQTMIHRG